jgi:hypothetical protein
MAKYEIINEWRFDEPIDEVFDLVREMCTWQEWWSGIKKVEKVVHGFEAGQGSLYHCIMKGWLPLEIKFTLVVVGVVLNKIVDGNVHGDITGFLKWEFIENKETTILRYHFKINDSRPFTHFTSFLLYPLYKLNYHYIFLRGQKGLALKLKNRIHIPAEYNHGY